MSFRIGSQKNSYVYSDTNMDVNGATVYKCVRGEDEHNNDYKLYLFREHDGHWQAVEDTNEATDPVNNGRKIFRTLNPVDNIVTPGWIHWQWRDETTWAGDMSFQTSRSQ